MAPARTFRNPELLMEVAVASNLFEEVFIQFLFVTGEFLGDFPRLLFNPVVDSLQEEQPKDVVLVVRCVNTSTQNISRLPRVRFQRVEVENFSPPSVYWRRLSSLEAILPSCAIRCLSLSGAIGNHSSPVHWRYSFPTSVR